MKLRKLDPKIIRVGDRIKIINPTFVTRCGYPLGIVDVRKEIEEKFGKAIEDLMCSVIQGKDEPTLRDNNFFLEKSEQKPKGYYEIVKALAYLRLKSLNYGGKERTLHTKVMEHLRDKEAIVVNVKIVKTGTYYPSSGGYDSWNGGYEYEPAYLVNCETHKLLELSVLAFQTEDWIASQEDCPKIEAINVEKLPSMMETAIEYEYRMKQLEKQDSYV